MDMESKATEICEVLGTVISCLKTEVDCGVMNADTVEVGQVADIIKDLASAEKYIRESTYYEKVAKAMDEKSTEPYGMGYSPRVSGNIRYGYKPMVDQEPYINGYLHDPEFKTKMGYSEYGTPYTEYMDARRHYTQTGSANDKAMMDMHAREHMEQTIETIEDIWDDATPELKQKMKTELKRLMDAMSI